MLRVVRIGLCLLSAWVGMNNQRALASQAEAWLCAVHPGLLETQRQVAQTQAALDVLGAPVVGQTVPQFGYLHPRLSAPPPASPWVQLDLQESVAIDSVALIPAQVDWQSVERPAYGFPLRFRIDVSDDEKFAAFTAIGIFTDTDFADPGIAPVTINAGGKRGRYVRLTVTKLAEENGQYFYSLGELMVLKGNRNLASGAAVRASATTSFPPRWDLAYLVDGKSALGPPIERELLPHDGLYSGPDPLGKAPWMAVDLGQVYAVDEVRLYPIHARLGADIPGFSFPKRMSVELSNNADFQGAVKLVDAGSTLLNPGNNALMLAGKGIEARYIRVTLEETSLPKENTRFGLSELEVYSGNFNVAKGAMVTAMPDPFPMSRNWPLSQLVDGYTSYGKLLEWPVWLEQWQRRTQLQTALQGLRARQAALEAVALQRLWYLGEGLFVLVVLTGAGIAIGINVRARRRRESELQRLRTQFAHDLHDEIGSNLAAISVISEMARQQRESANTENWEEIHRIAAESNEALREVLWVSGVRHEMGVDFIEQLQRAARRMLVGRDVSWSQRISDVPQEWPLESRRQVFLCFKEVLANVVRHSDADRVELSLDLKEGRICLKITDNGKGFAREHSGGTGFHSLQERAQTLGGTCRIEGRLGVGTTVEIQIPVPAL